MNVFFFKNVNLCYLGDDKKNEGDASYLLGLTYMENNDIETALLVMRFTYITFIEEMQ